jgi:hypothetical protein
MSCRSIVVVFGHLQNLVCQEFKPIGGRLTIDLDLLMDMVTLQKYTLPFTSMMPICHLLQHDIRTNRYLSTREIVGNSVSNLDSRTSLCLRPCKIILTWNWFSLYLNRNHIGIIVFLGYFDREIDRHALFSAQGTNTFLLTSIKVFFLLKPK